MNTQSVHDQPRIAKIWEVLANVRSTPADAAGAMLLYSGIDTSEEEAARQLEAAKERNTLKLVTVRPPEIASNWCTRMKIR